MIDIKQIANQSYRKQFTKKTVQNINKLSVLFFLLGSRRKASSRVRGFWIADEFTRLGAKCTVVYGEESASFFQCLYKLPWYDTVYVQKRCSRWDYYLMRLAGLLGKRTIFDIDDAYSRVKSKRTLRNIKRIMKNASVVTVGSKNLLEFAKRYQENTYFIPTSIKLENYQLPERKQACSTICLGWIGNGAYYCRDLIDILREPLKEIALQHKVRLMLVGACEQEELYKAFRNIPGLETTFIDSIDWADLTEVRKTMLEFDIGLYPVLANDFNLYKCGFKALEYMAMGIPVVASPVGANSYVVNNNVDGFHANASKEWVNALTLLITDKLARMKMGQAGRVKIEEEYNTLKTAKYLYKIFDGLKQNYSRNHTHVDKDDL